MKADFRLPFYLSSNNYKSTFFSRKGDQMKANDPHVIYSFCVLF